MVFLYIKKTEQIATCDPFRRYIYAVFNFFAYAKTKASTPSVIIKRHPAKVNTIAVPFFIPLRPFRAILIIVS
ncbi:MAG: hypothetical protein DBY05_09270 [Clostridiales bacterium]|nr:MAG: hypothetical protein DBY05_09270 [Clostridiales bacterium]